MRSRMSRRGSATPKKMPTAVKIPCHASVTGPMWMLGSNGIWINEGLAPQARGLSSVTLLELLARAAPAGIVAAELGVRSRGGAAVPAPARDRAAARAGLRPVLRFAGRSLLGLLGLLRRSHRDSKNGLRDAGRDARGHLLIEGVGLALVRDERVLLSVPTQVDALAQLFHRRQGLDPRRADRPQQHPPLNDACKLVAELLLTRFVGIIDDLGHALTELVLVEHLAEAVSR